MKRNIFIYGVILVISLGILIMYQNFYTMLLVLVLILIPLISCLIFRRAIQGVHTDIYLSQGRFVECGKEIQLQIRVSKKGKLPITSGELLISYENGYEEKPRKEVLAVAAVGDEELTICYYLHTNHVGAVEIQIRRVRYFDYFRLVNKHYLPKKTLKTYVIPTIVPITVDPRNYLSQDSDDSEIYSEDYAGNDPSQVFDIREYNMNDNIRNIHWKLSSKKESLMVKEFSLPIESVPLIFVDAVHKRDQNRQEFMRDMDLLLAVLGSASYSLVQEGIEHQISWVSEEKGQESTPNLTISQESAVSEMLILFLESRQPAEPAGIQVYESLNHNHMIYITNCFYEEILEEAARTYENTRLTFIVIGKQGKEEDYKRYEESYGVRMILVKDSKEFHDTVCL